MEFINFHSSKKMYKYLEEHNFVGFEQKGCRVSKEITKVFNVG